jgi:hypothetical protein
MSGAIPRSRNTPSQGQLYILPLSSTSLNAGNLKRCRRPLISIYTHPFGKDPAHLTRVLKVPDSNLYNLSGFRPVSSVPVPPCWCFTTASQSTIYSSTVPDICHLLLHNLIS